MDTPPLPTESRPKALGAAAIICIIFGALGLLGLFSALMAAANVQLVSGQGADEITKALQSEPHVRNWQIYGGLINAVAGGVAVAAGIGLLKCRNWARNAAIGWSVYHGIASIVGAWISSVYLAPAMEQAMRAQFHSQLRGSAAEADKVAEMLGGFVGVASAVFGCLFAFAVAVSVIVLVTRPRARAACLKAAS